MRGVTLEKKTARRIGRATLAIEKLTTVPGTQPNYGRGPGVHSILQILLMDTISAATWDSGDRKLTPQEFTARMLIDHEDGDGLTYLDDYGEVTGRSYYLTAVTVSSGKARYAWLVDGRLLITDCTEFTL